MFFWTMYKIYIFMQCASESLRVFSVDFRSEGRSRCTNLTSEVRFLHFRSDWYSCTRDKWLWLGIFGISVEDYDCRLLRPTYRTHDGSPPSADMFGITSQKIWSKMTSSYTIVNVLNTATETAEKALFSPVPRIYLGDSTQT